MKNESRKALLESAERIGEHCNWGCIEGYVVPESDKVEYAILQALRNVEDGAHNGLYIETSRDEYLTFLYKIYDKLKNEGNKWCDN